MKTSLKVLTILSAVSVFSGCPDKGGGGSPAAQAVTTLGIQQDGKCTQEVMTIFDNIRRYQNTQNTRNDCARLSLLIADKSCQAQSYYGNQPTIITYLQVQNTCQQAGNTTVNPNQPGYNQPIQGVATKNVICSIDITSGTAAGSISNMPVQVFANGSNTELYSDMTNTKTYWRGMLKYTRQFSSQEYADLKLNFKPGNSNAADTLTLSANLRGGKTATASGFAGSEVRIEIASDNERDTSLVVSCAGQDQFNAGAAPKGSKIRCLIKEDAGVRPTIGTTENTMSDLINLGLSPSVNSNLYLEGNDQGILTTSVAPSTAYESYKIVTGLTSPSSVKIKSPGYSLESNCTVR